MQVQLLVERDQNECIVRLAGTAYKFKRNGYGHLVSDITDQEHIKWASDPTHNTSFKLYSEPKKKIIEEVTDEVVEKVVAEAVTVVVAEELADDPEVPEPSIEPKQRNLSKTKGSKR